MHVFFLVVLVVRFVIVPDRFRTRSTPALVLDPLLVRRHRHFAPGGRALALPPPRHLQEPLQERRRGLLRPVRIAAAAAAAPPACTASASRGGRSDEEASSRREACAPLTPGSILPPRGSDSGASVEEAFPAAVDSFQVPPLRPPVPGVRLVAPAAVHARVRGGVVGVEPLLRVRRHVVARTPVLRLVRRRRRCAQVEPRPRGPVAAVPLPPAPAHRVVLPEALLDGRDDAVLVRPQPGVHLPLHPEDPGDRRPAEGPLRLRLVRQDQGVLVRGVDPAGEPPEHLGVLVPGEDEAAVREGLEPQQGVVQQRVRSMERRARPSQEQRVPRKDRFGVLEVVEARVRVSVEAGHHGRGDGLCDREHERARGVARGVDDRDPGGSEHEDLLVVKLPRLRAEVRLLLMDVDFDLRKLVQELVQAPGVVVVRVGEQHVSRDQPKLEAGQGERDRGAGVDDGALAGPVVHQDVGVVVRHDRHWPDGARREPGGLDVDGVGPRGPAARVHRRQRHVPVALPQACQVEGVAAPEEALPQGHLDTRRQEHAEDHEGYPQEDEHQEENGLARAQQDVHQPPQAVAGPRWVEGHCRGERCREDRRGGVVRSRLRAEEVALFVSVARPLANPVRRDALVRHLVWPPRRRPHRATESRVRAVVPGSFVCV
eukprot:CAMPEP_0114499210 /NCGR_PEP_ID=MMETSP0109-20121206/7293_1 /TAXON_ID=29199 /ORGANISM="Chlorarachnion reptans, Strain CCCM449" /LENGTH=655 /DNA_ID=CAMNT_0001676757 /DNA_START=439 /DNA_END=2403 /DNA_ORIENTATION=+